MEKLKPLLYNEIIDFKALRISLFIPAYTQQEGYMKTINELLASSIERFGSKPALFQPATKSTLISITYATLQQKVHAFAGHLQQEQISKGDAILIWGASSMEWLIAYLGALQVGAVLVPLDVSSKEDFIHRISDTTGAVRLITTQKQFDSLKSAPTDFINMDALPEGPFDSTTTPSISGDDLAEIVFTSGTTGQPKGVMLSHYNIVSNATSALKIVAVTSADRLLSILPLSHMFELTIEMALLHAGASITYAKTLNPETIMDLFARQKITVMVLVPQALQLFYSGIEREVRRSHREKQFAFAQRIAAYLPFSFRRLLFKAVHQKFGEHVRVFVSGGAYLPPRLGEQWENMGFRVLQGYGATECSPVIAATPMNVHRFDIVGGPFPDVQVKIASDGEILVQGPNVAQGYWHNPEETAVAFKDGWYHTGDLGKLDKQHFLSLKGRKKNLIVLANGMNVYPEDIENTLREQDGVKDAVVLGLSKRDQGSEVHAVLLLEDPQRAKTIVGLANKQLASHQQIRGYTIWPNEDFPRTHTLKVKRPEVMKIFEEMQREASV